jgi:hypothetical protein
VDLSAYGKDREPIEVSVAMHKTVGAGRFEKKVNWEGDDVGLDMQADFGGEGEEGKRGDGADGSVYGGMVVRRCGRCGVAG